MKVPLARGVPKTQPTPLPSHRGVERGRGDLTGVLLLPPAGRTAHSARFRVCSACLVPRDDRTHWREQRALLSTERPVSERYVFFFRYLSYQATIRVSKSTDSALLFGGR